jgi:hypothetical protein
MGSWSSAQPAAQEELVALTGEQDAAIAGIVTILMLLVTVVYTIFQTWSSERSNEVLHLRWGPTTHVQFWFAMLGGSCAFMHYFFLLKAFEGAPSTVLLPLVQVASVSVLLGSSVVSLSRNEPWITPVQGLAYVLMFIGGILPSCGGQLSNLMEPAFWRQSFVYFAILAEFSLGMHDLMLSGCAYDSRAAQDESAGRDHTAASDEPLESTEFFVWSRVSFVATFIGMYLLSPKLYTELRDLLSGRVAMKYIGLSAISEGLTILGFYLASIAYGLFSQAAIVHAAEASLSQLLNLLIAYLLLRGFGIGRPSAIGSMTAKFVSFVMVTLGLFLCTLDDGRSVAANTAVPAASVTAPIPLPVTVPGFDSLADNGGAFTALTGVDQPLPDIGRGGGTSSYY